MSTALTQTTLAAAVDDVSTTIRLASCTNVPNPGGGGDNQTLIMINNEAMTVTKVSLDVPNTPSGAGQVSVVRGTNGTKARAHVSGAQVMLGRPNQFYVSDPSGAVDPTTVPVTPFVNVPTSDQWLPDTDRWIPGFGNPGNSGSPAPSAVMPVVASPNDLLLPPGPFFHVSGNNAITGFTIPDGYNGGPITIIPDGAFTWTNATNIAIAGTAVVGKALTFVYDPAAGKFYPSYIA